MSERAPAAPLTAEGIFGPQRRALSLGLLMTVLLIAFESLAVSTVLPQVARELNGLRLYGWSFSAFFIGFLVATVWAGGAGDRLGPLRPYLGALLVFAAGLLVAGLAPSMAVFIAGRAVQGAGGGALVAVAYLAVNRAYPDELRARVLALFSSAWVLPGLLGPALASLLSHLTGWRGVFLALLPLVLLAGLLTRPGLAPITAAGTDSPAGRTRAALLAGLGLALGLAALQRPALQAALLGGLGLLLALPALGWLYPPAAWRLRTPLSAGFAVRFLLALGFFGAESLLPLSLNRLRGLTLFQGGLVLTTAALVWTLGSLIQTRLDERTRGVYRAQVAVVGSLLVAAGIWTAGSLIHSTRPAWLVGAAMGLAALGMGLAFQAHTLVVLKAAPEGNEGEASGNLQLSDMLGSSVGAGVGGALVAGLGLAAGSSLHYGLMSGVLLLAALAAMRLRGRGVAGAGR